MKKSCFSSASSNSVSLTIDKRRASRSSKQIVPVSLRKRRCSFSFVTPKTVSVVSKTVRNFTNSGISQKYLRFITINLHVHYLLICQRKRTAFRIDKEAVKTTRSSQPQRKICRVL